MKPSLLLVPFQPARSFSIQRFDVPHFIPQWHYHHEVELTLICEGTGTRLVGDSIEHFGPGDLVLLGANLPHMWRSDAACHPHTDGPPCRSIVIHFREDFWGQSFLTLPETKPLRDLLDRAGRGIKLTGLARQSASRMMHECVGMEGIHSLIKLLDILCLIGQAAGSEILSSIGFAGAYTQTDAWRMAQVYEHVLARFQHEITLEEMAGQVHLSPKAFCRYFKSKARKTFTQFVSEVRVGHACKLLITDRLSIGQVAYQSGFVNLSNFNRQFKARMGVTPARYRSQYRTG